MSIAVSRGLWSGKDLLDAFTLSAALLDHYRDEINALNVFPVPDGDTGTNMALTMKGALEAMSAISPNADPSEVAGKLAYGSLMGARGNSGVILSQFFRGFASGLGQAEEIDGRDLARALEGSRETAYKAVMRPVEGTMLTVIREAAEAAQKMSRSRPAMADVLDAAVEGAQRALDGTPQQLEILRQAGVVDAGGQGIVHILDALARSARGETSLPAAPEPRTGQVGENMAFLEMIDEMHGEEGFGYCTNFMVFGQDIDADLCRTEIAAMGDSAVIVGDETMLKVHVHTSDPGEVLTYAARLGDLDQIKIDNMGMQTATLAAQRTSRQDESVGSAPSTPNTSSAIHDTISIIAIAAGSGVSDALRSLGANAIVRGGQTMNPSTQEMLSAVEAIPSAEIILLPNNQNITLAANQVDALTDKTVRVVPTRSIPAGLAALAAFNTDTDLAGNVEYMTRATEDILAISVTRSIRNVELNGVPVGEGELIGLVDDELTSSGRTDTEVVLTAFSASGFDDPELVTIFVGEDVKSSDQGALASSLAEAWPDAEIEMHPGGQPHYRYIISVE